MTINTDLAKQIADELLAEHAGRQRFHSVRDRLPSLDDAYDVQACQVAWLLDHHASRVGGYKIGLTTARLQHMCGVSQPIAGVVLASRILQSPAEVSFANYCRLGIESEVCIVMAREIGGDCTRADVQQALRSVHAAFEIVDDRDADYTRLDAISMVADNSWNAGEVLGPPGAPRLDLSARPARLSIDGQVTDGGTTGAAMGHPLDVVVWLARHLASRGERLRPGDIVSTGSLIPTQFARPGQHYRFEIDGLEPVSLEVRA